MQELQVYINQSINALLLSWTERNWVHSEE